MAEMYDKLGEMLNDALKNGEIPQFKREDREFSEKEEDSGLFLSKEDINPSENNPEEAQKDSKNGKSREKLYKYTDFMHFPLNIRNILGTLDIAHPFLWSQLKKDLLKNIKIQHPDTKNTIQNSKSVYNFRQIKIEELITYYKELDAFFTSLNDANSEKEK
ncbi:MAG: hypothetical protein K5829_11315 [Treponema sp.]|nr:hypothetical protein [Treponema sp.]